jgi:hypothetical protein
MNNIKFKTLVDLQLDAQMFVYLRIIHLLKSSTCFEHYPAYLQEVHIVIVYVQPLVSSLCKGELSKITVLQFAALLISEN